MELVEHALKRTVVQANASPLFRSQHAQPNVRCVRCATSIKGGIKRSVVSTSSCTGTSRAVGPVSVRSQCQPNWVSGLLAPANAEDLAKNQFIAWLYPTVRAASNTTVILRRCGQVTGHGIALLLFCPQYSPVLERHPSGNVVRYLR